jgi:hypothetical protein
MSATAVPPTESQMSFIKSLLDELQTKHGDDTMRAPLNEAYANRTLTRTSASAVIESLIAIRDYKRSQAPVAPKPVAAPVVESGLYALDNDGQIKFYEVRNGSGKWEGYTFLDAVASDDRYPIKNRQNRDEILSLIAAAPLDAMKLYGREVGKCGHCGKTLTSDWRKVGIGPVCIKKFG